MIFFLSQNIGYMLYGNEGLCEEGMERGEEKIRVVKLSRLEIMHFKKH